MFRDFVIDDPQNQAAVLEFGFRPGNPAVAISEPISATNGLNPAQPDTELQVPQPAVLAALVDSWETYRKPARVIIVFDISGSMGDLGGKGFSKLDLAKQAVLASLDQFKPQDEVGLWVFSTELNGPEDYVELVAPGALSLTRDDIEQRVRTLIADGGTGLYDTTRAAVAAVRDTFDITRINAVVLLTDGMCDDFAPGCEIAPLVRELSSPERETVRVFPVAYGADVDALRIIAEASQARLYTAADPFDDRAGLRASRLQLLMSDRHRWDPRVRRGKLLAKATLSPRGLAAGAVLAVAGLAAGIGLWWVVSASLAAWATSAALRLRDPMLLSSLHAPEFERDLTVLDGEHLRHMVQAVASPRSFRSRRGRSGRRGRFQRNADQGDRCARPTLRLDHLGPTRFILPTSARSEPPCKASRPHHPLSSRSASSWRKSRPSRPGGPRCSPR